jgi:hypothetical protein
MRRPFTLCAAAIAAALFSASAAYADPTATPIPFPSSSSATLTPWPDLPQNLDYQCSIEYVRARRRAHHSYAEAGDAGMLRASALQDAEQMSQCYDAYKHPAFLALKMDFYTETALANHDLYGLDSDTLRYVEIAVAAGDLLIRYNMPKAFKAAYDDDYRVLMSLANKRR